MPVVRQVYCKGALETEASSVDRAAEPGQGSGGCGTACSCSTWGSCHTVPCHAVPCHSPVAMESRFGPAHSRSCVALLWGGNLLSLWSSQQLGFFLSFNIVFSVPCLVFSCLHTLLVSAAWRATARLNWETKPWCALLTKLLGTPVYSARLLRIHTALFHLFSLKWCRMNIFQMERQVTGKKRGKNK